MTAIEQACQGFAAAAAADDSRRAGLWAQIALLLHENGWADLEAASMEGTR